VGFLFPINEPAVVVQAGSGDFVQLRKDSKIIGVIDRLTSSRVRVLVNNKYGKYVESNLIYYKSGQPERTPQQGKSQLSH